jgi:hypothetical protein
MLGFVDPSRHAPPVQKLPPSRPTPVRALPAPAGGAHTPAVTVPPRPAPAKARPAPTKARPAPAKARPAPTKARPAPAKARPAPAKARPAPAKARPAPAKARSPKAAGVRAGSRKAAASRPAPRKASARKASPKKASPQKATPPKAIVTGAREERPASPPTSRANDGAARWVTSAPNPSLAPSLPTGAGRPRRRRPLRATRLPRPLKAPSLQDEPAKANGREPPPSGPPSVDRQPYRAPGSARARPLVNAPTAQFLVSDTAPVPVIPAAGADVHPAADPHVLGAYVGRTSAHGDLASTAQPMASGGSPTPVPHPGT